MLIELPDDLIDRIRITAAAYGGISDVELLRKAFDALDLLDEELMETAEIEQRVAEFQAGNAVTTPWAKIRDESLRRLRDLPSDQ